MKTKVNHTDEKNKIIVPKLPSADLKIGVYVYTAMRNLEAAGYTFTEQEIDEMCTSKWSKEHFHTIKPFICGCRTGCGK